MYLLQGQRLDWGEGVAAAYEDAAEVRAAGFGSSSAPPTHSHSQFFFFFFFGCSLCLLRPHILLPSNSSLFAHLFFQCLAFHFCLFYPLSLFIILDWACIRSISNANGAAQIDTSYVLPIAICSKESFVHFTSIVFVIIVESLWSLSLMTLINT